MSLRFQKAWRTDCVKTSDAGKLWYGVPEQVEASSAEELEKYRAMAFYTDGTKVAKRVDWDLSTVDFAVPGTYKIKETCIRNILNFRLRFIVPILVWRSGRINIILLQRMMRTIIIRFISEKRIRFRSW